MSDRSDNERGAVWALSVSDEGFLDHFGDEANWAAGRSYWWLLLDAERIRVWPLDPYSDIALHAPWQGALDLLAFGKGWVDIPEELQDWRKAGYPKSDPILRFLAANFGDSIAYLELYLKLFPTAEAKLRGYLTSQDGNEAVQGQKRCFADDINELADYVRKAVLRDPNCVATPHVRAFMPWILDERPRIFETDDLREGLGGGWDEGHIFTHFAHDWWRETTGEMENGDTIEVLSSTSWRVEFARYADWYLKLNNLLNHDRLSQLSEHEPEVVDVFVHGVGSLGLFERCSRTGRMIRKLPVVVKSTEARQVGVTTSPRFGFEITEEMARELATAEPHELHIHAETLEMLGRDGVDWIYTFGWGASNADGTKYWSRDEGAWSEYYPTVEGIKFTTFLQQAIAGEHLDLELPLYEAVMDGSTCHDIQPWASALLLAEWDKPTPFPRLYAELGSMWEKEPITQGNLEPEVWALLTARMHEIFPRPKPQGQTDDEIALFQLVFYGDEEMTAAEVLNVLVTGDREQHA